MRFLSTRRALRGQDAPSESKAGEVASFTKALFDGLAPDGGLYVPETIEPWTADELSRLPRRTLTEIGLRALRPFTRGEIDPATLEAVVVDALNFPIPLVEVEPDIFALELFHGPTLAFKDVGARIMARLMSSLYRGDDALTVLVATSGDTGSAVAHAFHRVPNTRVVILYPDGRVSPTQEAQLTMFNGERSNVRAYAVAGSFDECHRLAREAFGDVDLRSQMRLTSANSVNVGRLLPQSVYYFHAVAQLPATGRASSAPTAAAQGPTSVAQGFSPAKIVFSTPSGNFGNLTAGLMAKRAGLPIARFVAATNANDVVPLYLETGRFEPRPSLSTLSNAMDVGHPSNFERMLWLYNGDLEAMRQDIAGCHFTDDDVRATITRVYEERGYLLDPHSAIAYMGLVGRDGRERREQLEGRVGVFLATAHPAKFAEIVEPIIGRPVEKPEPLAQALGRPQHIIRIRPSLDRVKGMLDG
jgi:threonine synthase